ncbi:hypothetical protein Tco_1116209 [Tanacetum coccineum]
MIRRSTGLPRGSWSSWCPTYLPVSLNKEARVRGYTGLFSPYYTPTLKSDNGIRRLKIESEPINAYFKNKGAVHLDYQKVTKEHIETLQELLEQARALKPLDQNLDYACKFAQGIQEVLVYVSASCPFTQSGDEK